MTGVKIVTLIAATGLSILFVLGIQAWDRADKRWREGNPHSPHYKPSKDWKRRAKGDPS